ncbi:TPA: hypothetical protein MAD21_000352 [Klebsiella pneumoniae]|nr:hypothetical protein [Klebsiella pneumoniae]HCC2837894.1 hypothetical protein [Klebsiella pneumoniae]HED8804863.1 hypothetical protein [Klebsiella pneumoniae]
MDYLVVTLSSHLLKWLCNAYSNGLHKAPVLRGRRPKILTCSRTLSLHIRSTIRQSAFSGEAFTETAEMTRSTTRRNLLTARLTEMSANEMVVIIAQQAEIKREHI